MRNKWKSCLGTAALVVALVLVANPELRALLMLAEAVGLEALVLLVVAQLRFYAPVLGAALRPGMAATCQATFFGLGAVTRVVGLLSPHGYLTHLWQWAVAATTQDLQCSAPPTATQITS